MCPPTCVLIDVTFFRCFIGSCFCLVWQVPLSVTHVAQKAARYIMIIITMKMGPALLDTWVRSVVWNLFCCVELLRWSIEAFISYLQKALCIVISSHFLLEFQLYCLFVAFVSLWHELCALRYLPWWYCMYHFRNCFDTVALSWVKTQKLTCCWMDQQWCMAIERAPDGAINTDDDDDDELPIVLAIIRPSWNIYILSLKSCEQFRPSSDFLESCPESKPSCLVSRG